LKAVQSVTAYGLQILAGTVTTHAYVAVMTVVLSTADMWIRITREWPPMSEHPFACPECGSMDVDIPCYAADDTVYLGLQCYDCAAVWDLAADAAAFQIV